MDPNFWVVFEHTETLALYQGPICVKSFFFKDAYCTYFSFATLESYVACFKPKVFKLVCAHPHIPLWLENSMTFSTFCHLFFTWFSDILNRVTWTKTDILLIFHYFFCLQNIGPYSWSSSLLSFHISGSSALTVAGALICFITPPFSYTLISVWISLICRCNLIWNILFNINS